MGTVLVFAAGYVLGAQAREQHVDEVVKALRAVATSAEFRELARTARAHAADSLRGMAGLLDRMGTANDSLAPADLVERVRSITGRR